MDRPRISGASLLGLTSGATELQHAERAMTAVAESVHRFTGVRVDGNGLHQLHSQRQLPRWSHARLVEVELTAHQLQARSARTGDRRQQITNGQVRTIDPLPWTARVVVRCIHPWSSRCLRGRWFVAAPPAPPRERRPPRRLV
jgi:hypothetical protein